MRSLRQLLRLRSPESSAEPARKRRDKRRQGGETRRRLSTQALEQRQLLAGDVVGATNSINPYDVNQDFQISPGDALSVINYLAANHGAEGESSSEDENPFAGRKVDVNGDGVVSPGDALMVINALGRGEGMDPIIELSLTARDADDNELFVDANGLTEVQTGIDNSFFLEVAYTDLRVDPLGLFTIFPDIGVSQDNALQPVMREVQQVVVDAEYLNATTGVLQIGLEGETFTRDVALTDINDLDDEIEAFLIENGVRVAGEFDIESPSFLNEGGNEGFQIFYLTDADRNVDVPDLTFTPINVDVAFDVDFTEFSPVEDDGVTLNDAPLRFALDTRSRTLDLEISNIVIPNAEFYNSLNRGSFNPVAIPPDPDADPPFPGEPRGFVDIGGVGPLNAGGVPAVDRDGEIEQPFDAFRIEVFLTRDVSNLVVDVNPGSGTDPLALYGDDEDNANVPDDLVVTDEDSVVTLTTGVVGINTPPTLNTTPLTETVSEDDTATTIDLLTDATDIDNDTLSVTDFTIVSGDDSGLTLNGTNLDLDPSAYNGLMAGQDEIIVATYTVTDGFPNSPTQTLTITVNGQNDPPVVTGPIAETVSENASQFNIDLLQNASDPDGDTLDAVNIVQNGSDDASGITVDGTNNQLVVDPSAYAALEDGQSVTVTYDFDVDDGNGGVVATQVSVTINGDTPNQNPTVTGPLTLTASEDDADTSLDLLTGASDPDVGDVLSVDGLTLASGDDAGITVNGNSLDITPSSYNALADGETEVITYTYNVIDGEGGSVAQSATITINGANDAPVVTGPVTATISEDDPSTNVDLLTGASDPDNGDTVSIQNLALVSGDDSGVTTGTDELTVDPSAYNALAVGESAVIVYSYDLVDSNSASTSQTATITITGVNDAPTVGAPIEATFSEDDASASVALLTGASDPDTSDVLSVDALTVVSGDATGITLVGNSLSVDPSAYNSLAAGETEIVTYTYNVVDGNSGSASQTATITINGANDAPVVTGPLQIGFTEDEGTQTASLLDGASDPDASDTLSVADVNVSGDDTGIVRNGADLTINTGAYGDLEDGQSVVVTFTYNVTDGTESVAQTATVTITGVGDTPTVSGPVTITFDERDATSNVDLLQGATDPNGDPLSVINAVVASGDASGVTIDEANNRLIVDPSAYRDLNDGETAVIVVNYEITDPESNTVAQTATVTITGRTFVPSTISGQLFVDGDVNPGILDEMEEALGSVPIRLIEQINGGESVIATVVTNADGEYAFTDVDPGTYFVEYEIPDSVVFHGSTRGQIVVGDVGGETFSGPDLNPIGLVGVLQRLDYLVKTYVAAGIIDTTNLPEGLGGGSVHLNEDGTQKMFVAEEHFDVEFAEVVLNDSRDAALLTIIDLDGIVKSARLTLDQFIVAGEGEGVRFYGNMSDFDFVENPGSALTDEFEDYRNAIDMALESGM